MVSGEGAVFPDPSLALVMKAGAIRLDSGDWLVNQHEYWHDLDPFVSDGTNTVLSILARSIDERIAGRNPATAWTVFNDYLTNARTNVFVRNPGCWASPLCSDGGIAIGCKAVLDRDFSTWFVGQIGH